MQYVFLSSIFVTARGTLGGIYICFCSLHFLVEIGLLAPCPTVPIFYPGLGLASAGLCVLYGLILSFWRCSLLMSRHCTRKLFWNLNLELHVDIVIINCGGSL
jgi:hypothetical protein